ncbi:MAG: hypothetical protein QXY29_03275 [Candidatus Aenigmatarchaeota archaeon]
MKGIELPINLIIIIIIAAVVLLGVLYLFSGSFTTSGGTVSLESARSQGCQELIRSGKCGDVNTIFNIMIKDFDANKNRHINDKPAPSNLYGDNLAALCYNYYNCPCFGISTETTPPSYFPIKDENCLNCCNKKVCGCLV